MPAELPKHAGRHEPRHRRPVPELAVIIGSPAVHARARTRRNGAGVVQTCRGDAQAEGASGHRRRQLGQRRVITDLTAAVGTPAVSDAGGRNAAGVVPAAAHDGEHDPALHGGGHQLVNCRVIAQLSVPVAAPAVRRAGRRYSAGVRVPCLHGREGHRSRGTCLDRRRLVDSRVIAELTEGVVTPTIHGATRSEAAAVVESRGEGRKCHAPRGLDQHGAELINAAMVAELAGKVRSPAVHAASGGREAAAEAGPRTHGGERDPGRRRHPNGQGSVDGRAVAQPPELVPAPTIGVARRRDRAGVLPAGADGLERDARGGVPAPGVVRMAAVALCWAAVACLQNACWTAIWTSGLIAPPDGVARGWITTASCAAAPLVMATGALVALVRPLAEATSL